MNNNQFEFLKELVYKGAANKNLVINDIVLDRLRLELSVIENGGFINYFITYSHIIEICNELNLLRSYGRGSDPGSLVNYCLDITKINPVAENLIFERFIQPSQNILPDIDIDIPTGYQEMVIEKLKQKYPEYHAYFIAFLPQFGEDYKNIIYNNIIYKKHPSGIIITHDKIMDSTFFYEDQEFYLYDDTTEDPNYANKFDLVELEYLNRLQLIVDEIGIDFHPYNLPLNDLSTFDFFVSDNLENIIQFETDSQKQIIDQFLPQSIRDLSIINAMSYPRLNEYFPSIMLSKFYEKEIYNWGDKRVTDILDETYGFLIYQESFLHLSHEIAGISLSDAVLWFKKIIRDKSNLESIVFSSFFADGCRVHSTLNEYEINLLSHIITEMLP